MSTFDQPHTARRALVTGATGFIGRHVLEPLRACGCDVHAVSSRAIPPGRNGVTWHRANLHDKAAVSAVLTAVEPTDLLHFAWAMVPGGTAGADDQVRWVESTLGLLRGFRACGGHRAVLAGTCAEYDWRHGYCVEGITPLAPRTTYGVCKQALWSVSEAYARELDLSLAWGRIFFVYGPREPLPRFVPSLVSSLIRREAVSCTHGEQIRDYLHVDDVAHAFVALLLSDVRGAVNIASGVPVRLREIAEYASRRLDAASLVKLGALTSPPDDPPLLVADVRRLANDVGWRPRLTLQSGLDDTIDWWAARLEQVGAAGSRT
jgi:nucleoside-diphosphate-sugar epimerase